MTTDSAPSLKRFYQKAEAIRTDNDLYAVCLDGRPARTPKRAPLASRRQTIANAVAAEWDQAGDEINLQSMELTKLVSTALDLGEENRAAWVDEIVSYLSSDLLCYRAEAPLALVERQEKIWAPFLLRFEQRFGVGLHVTAGIISVAQPDKALEAAKAWLARQDDERLAGLHRATILLGSAVLAVALAEKEASAEEIFTASRLDETFQREQWGDDAEALAREESLRASFDAVARFVDLTRD